MCIYMEPVSKRSLQNYFQYHSELWSRLNANVRLSDVIRVVWDRNRLIVWCLMKITWCGHNFIDDIFKSVHWTEFCINSQFFSSVQLTINPHWISNSSLVPNRGEVITLNQVRTSSVMHISLTGLNWPEMDVYFSVSYEWLPDLYLYFEVVVYHNTIGKHWFCHNISLLTSEFFKML